MKKLFAVLICIFSIKSYAQIDYPIFKDTAALQPADSGRLSLSIDNLNYLRNYEYFGNIPLSYTLFGYQFVPQLKYQLNKNFSVKGGVFLRREFGLKGFTNVAPVFTATYQKKGLTLNLGNLEGALNHRFIEPIYDVESIINDRIEQGAQIILNKKKLWLDWFIDWEKAIKRHSSFPEELTSGVSSRFKILEKEKLQLEVPAQILVAHKGGQIDSSHTPVESLLNTAIGVVATVPMNGFLKAIKVQQSFAYFKDISGTKAQLYKEGVGWYSALIFQSKWNIDLDLRYWKGDRFHGPRGGALYSSISEQDSRYGEKNRDLLFASVIYDKQLFPNLWIDLRLEPYYDLNNKMLEYSYSVFLRLNKDFFLKRF